MYDYYSNCKPAKQVWEALQKKYDIEEADAKKYDVSRYLNYKMVDERSVESQSHEIQKIAHEIITEGMPRLCHDNKRVIFNARNLGLTPKLNVNIVVKLK